MSRDISTLNEAQVDGSHVHEVILVKLEFDTPVYVHSGFGDIIFDSNTYKGVGQFGAISQVRESEALSPSPINLSLDGTDSALVAEALDAGNYGDIVTIYNGHRQDDGTLVDDPDVIWSGKYDFATAETGERDNINITAEHDLAVLNEKNGERVSDEDQQKKFSGDLGLEYLHDQAYVKLAWGRHNIVGAGTPDIPREGGPLRVK